MVKVTRFLLPVIGTMMLSAPCASIENIGRAQPIVFVFEDKTTVTVNVQT